MLDGIERFEESKRFLLVDGLSMVYNFCYFFWIKFGLNKCNYNCNMHVTMDKWMDIPNIGHVIASRYNVTLVSLSLQQSITFFSLRSQSPTDCFVHRVICIGHMYDNHFVQVNA